MNELTREKHIKNPNICSRPLNKDHDHEEKILRKIKLVNRLMRPF